MSTKKTKQLLFLSLVSLCLYCKSNPKQAVSLNGVWEQEGYGFILEMKDSLVRTYDINQVACTFFSEENLATLGEIKELSASRLLVKDGLNEYKFKRLEALPSLCSDTLSKNDPVHNFETLWHTFKEHYCYFEERNIDWKASYDKFRPRINAESTDLELYTVLSDMIASLKDGHAKIEGSSELKKAYKKQGEQKKKPRKVGTLKFLELGEQIANKYLLEVKTYHSGAVRWGLIETDVLYLQINFMFLMADYDLPKDLGIVELFQKYSAFAENSTNPNRDEIAGIDKLLAAILTNTKAKSCILDLRFNGGGKDEVALSIMGHFVEEKSVVSSKKSRLGNQFSAPLDIYLEPKSPYFSGQLFMLTSHETASASEVLVMSSLPYPHVKRIGSKTEGIFSDMLDKKLPNGWEYSLSNEVYLDTQGKSYEHIGIPPDIDLDYPKDKIAFYDKLVKELENGDEAIETALKLIKSK